jgi:hypothetical protein
VTADDRQDGSDGECLERDEGDREHETDRQRSARWRPYPACRAGRRVGRRRWGSGPICAHQGDSRTSTAVDVKHERARPRHAGACGDGTDHRLRAPGRSGPRPGRGEPERPSRKPPSVWAWQPRPFPHPARWTLPGTTRPKARQGTRRRSVTDTASDPHMPNVRSDGS